MGMIPYIEAGYPIIDALFEASSGFSTTGSTIITDIESQPRLLLFWRSLTQWLGGMGVIVLLVSLIPTQGTGSRSLFESEVPGPYKEGLVPQIKNTGRVLWIIYIFLTLLCCLVYRVLGMTWYQSINHALTTIATGGFSTSNTSFANFSIPLQWAAIFLCFVAVLILPFII